MSDPEREVGREEEKDLLYRSVKNTYLANTQGTKMWSCWLG